jgi:hypothetical protein
MESSCREPCVAGDEAAKAGLSLLDAESSHVRGSSDQPLVNQDVSGDLIGVMVPARALAIAGNVSVTTPRLTVMACQC